jgi:GNAT superfamily N-acetyltransferase
MNSQETGSEALASGLLIRSAVMEDADGIACTFLESAEHHASLDPARYAVPSATEIAARYREGRQHPPESAAITLVAELGGAIVGFLDARLDRSPDPMHRELLYCVVVEIAVSQQRRGWGVGGRLLMEVEAWGREHGAHYVSLEYLAANTRASEFYQRRMEYHVAHITAIKRL